VKFLEVVHVKESWNTRADKDSDSSLFEVGRDSKQSAVLKNEGLIRNSGTQEKKVNWFSSVPEFLSSRFIIVPLPCLPYSLKNPFKKAKSQDSKHPTTSNA
jgi:hypothetical protein